MKYELTSILNILVIDKNMYLFPELFFCDDSIALHAPIKRDPTTTNFSIAQTSYLVRGKARVGRKGQKTLKIEQFWFPWDREATCT